MENYSNNYSTTINQTGGIGTTDTTITVASVVSAPAVNFRIVIENEYMLVTGIAGNVFTVTRAQEGSTAAAHANNTTVTHALTAAGLTQGISDRAKHLNVHYGDFTVDADAATITLDFSITDKHTITLGGNRTLAFSNMSNGQVGLIELVQDATGSRTVTWPTIRWTAPTLTTTPNKADLITIIRLNDGTYTGSLSIGNY